MANVTPPYNSFPASVKNALLFLFMGWIGNFFFLFKLLGPDMSSKIFLQQLVIAIVVCFFVLRIRNWARIMAIVSNFLIIIIYFIELAITLIGFLYYGKSINIFILALVNFILFSISTYYFLVKSTSEFYKMHSPRVGARGKGDQEED